MGQKRFYSLTPSLHAASALDCEGISAEVIDLRTLWPWDQEMVFASVAKTGRLVVAHEAVHVGGFGAELVAEAAERQFALLKSPPVRVASPRAPVPYSKPLEDMFRVTATSIIAAAHATLRGNSRNHDAKFDQVRNPSHHL